MRKLQHFREWHRTLFQTKSLHIEPLRARLILRRPAPSAVAMSGSQGLTMPEAQDAAESVFSKEGRDEVCLLRPLANLKGGMV